MIAEDRSFKLDGQIHDDETMKGRESRCNIEVELEVENLECECEKSYTSY